MDRRESIKTLLMSSLGAGMLFTTSDAKPIEGATPLVFADGDGYGRTPKEKARDERLFKETFFTEHELETVAVLCDLILPATSTAGSAGDAGVPDFIAFIVKDMTYLKTPLRGGMAWLDNRAKKKYGSVFKDCKVSEQTAMLDEIAYPDKETEETAAGIQFFRQIRNLTLTGYYTTEMGFNDLGYVGNTPNIWDGVPEDVLKEHGMSYEKEWLKKCVDQSKRTDIAEWDEDGNLLN